MDDRGHAGRDRRAGFWAAAGVCVYAGFLGGVFVALGDVSRDGDLGPILPFLAWSAANAVAATLCAAAGAALSYAPWRDWRTARGRGRGPRGGENG